MKRILLIDQDDPRRQTRVLVLKQAGYHVTTADHFEDVEFQSESRFDLVLIDTSDIQKDSVAYGERLKSRAPSLPVLLLSERGLFLPKESLLAHSRDGHQSPQQTLAEIASLLFDSTHERET